MLIRFQATAPRVSALIIAFAALATGSPQAAVAEPILKQTNTTYDIRGSNIRELKAAMRAHGPSSVGSNSAEHNTIIVGQTATSISWTYQYIKERNGCFPNNVTVTLVARVLLPLWNDKLHATYALQDEWDRYRLEVERHEQRHVEIAYEGARNLERGIKTARADKCEDLKAVIRTITDSHLEQTRQKQHEFDAREGSCELTRSCMRGVHGPAVDQGSAKVAKQETQTTFRSQF